MKIQNVLVGVLLLVVVGGGTYFAYRRVAVHSEKCDMCGRMIHTGHEVTLLMKDGTRIRACCPRCALHRAEHGPGEASRILVTDRATGREILAQDAVYVEGSDEITCIPESETPPRELGVEYKTVYDRCVPSLVAFKDEAAARQFMIAHGGRLLSYAQVVESVRER